MRTFLKMLVVACVLAAPQAASAEPSAKALALTRRMVTAMDVEKTMTPMLQTMVRQQMEMTVAGRDDLSDQQKVLVAGAVGEIMDEIFAGGFMSQVMEALVPAYAEVYSEDELEAVVIFYESPMGQRVLRKMPLMGPAANKAMIEITPKLQAQMTEKLAAKLESLKALEK